KCFVCFHFLSDVTAGAGESTTSCQPRAPHTKHGPKLPADWQEAKPAGNDPPSRRSSKLKNASNSGQRVASRPAPTVKLYSNCTYTHRLRKFRMQ
ncbi:unnamed protein product, partial [Ixodes persulcatus]